MATQYSATAMSTDAVRKPEVEDELNRLQQEVQYLDNALEALHQRRGPVLRSEAPCALASKESEAPSYSSVGGSIRSSRERVSAMANVVDRIRERLEI